MKGDDACIFASQLDLLIDVRRMDPILRCICLLRLLSSGPLPGDGAPLPGGAGKLPCVFRSVLIVFQLWFIHTVVSPDGQAVCRAARPFGYLPAGDTLFY